MPDNRKLVERAKKVAFMKVGESYVRMKGFTSLPMNKAPKEYTRQYVDELFETTDVVGISPSIDFAFDQYEDDLVHDALSLIIDEEKIGADAVVEILIVDFTKAGTNADTYEARTRKYTVVPNSEGGSLDAYTYEGTFRANSEFTKGFATSTDEFETNAKFSVTEPVA